MVQRVRTVRMRQMKAGEVRAAERRGQRLCCHSAKSIKAIRGTKKKSMAL